VADHLGDACAAIGLRELGVTGKRVDEITGQVGAVGRRQRGALLASELIRHDQFMAVLGDDKIGAGALEVAGEQQVRVLDDDRVLWRMSRYGLDMHLRLRVKTVTRRRQTSVKFSNKIQKDHRK